jgi:hypothetical protein
MRFRAITSPRLVVHYSCTASLGILFAWIAALWGATFAAFGRQDIN